jgi:hypothetical protein
VETGENQPLPETRHFVNWAMTTSNLNPFTDLQGEKYATKEEAG